MIYLLQKRFRKHIRSFEEVLPINWTNFQANNSNLNVLIYFV